MKVGIITAHWAHNHGAMLQAYALTTVLEQLGHDCDIIDFVTPLQEKLLKIYRPDMEGGMRGHLRSLRRYFHNICHYKIWKQRWINFENFKKEQLRLSIKRYRSNDELIKNSPECDAYICGSDQIWRSIKGSATQFNPAYYLCFAKNTNARRISYAPSFGADYVPEELKSKYKERIRDIEYLSIREIQGREIIKKLTGRDATVVLDPTLLLPASEWQNVMKTPVIDSPYILVYLVNGNPKKMGELIAEVKNHAPGHKVVALSTSSISTKIPNVDIEIFDAGPFEFLGWFNNASFVCTSSFHGMVYSFIFRKAFYAIMPHRISSRLTSLGRLLKLNSRLLEHKITVHENPFEIDFSEAKKLWQKEKNKSIDFLKTALNTDSKR